MSDQPTAEVARVIAMTRTEFYTACEAIGLEIHEDHNMPTPRHPIALRQRDAFWANRNPKTGEDR